MQGDTAFNGQIIIGNLHVIVHFFVDETEDECFVAHQSLVMTFGITDRLFFGSMSGQFMKEVTEIPILVSFFFKRLNPEVGYTHTEAIVKADAAC